QWMPWARRLETRCRPHPALAPHRRLRPTLVVLYRGAVCLHFVGWRETRPLPSARQSPWRRAGPATQDAAILATRRLGHLSRNTSKMSPAGLRRRAVPSDGPLPPLLWLALVRGIAPPRTRPRVGATGRSVPALPCRRRR